MKKFNLVISIFLLIIIGLFLFGNLIYSGFTSTPISELIQWEWWVLFLATDIWATQQWKRLKDKSK
jgi:hypothetical protein